MQSLAETREQRGKAIVQNSVIKENADGSFEVPSQTRTDVVYQVSSIGSSWVCSCPDFLYRADRIEVCKHASAVKFWTSIRQEKAKPKVFADDAVQCAKCGSIRVVKFGHENGKQVWKCHECGRKFRDSLLRNARYSPETVTLTLDLYFSGMSLRKITRTLNDHFDMSLGKSSVARWIETFVPQISGYVNSLAPQVSETWQVDEVFVKMKGGEEIKARKMKNMAYLWNVMDTDVRRSDGPSLAYCPITGTSWPVISLALWTGGSNSPQLRLFRIHG